MKKIVTMLLALALTGASMFACGETGDDTTAADTTAVEDTTVEEETTVADDTTAEEDTTAAEEVVSTADTAKGEGVMTYAEYAAAAIDDEVVIEAYVQGKQSFWDNKGTFYTQDADGAYFLYEMACTEEEYNQLTVGTKIKVTGFKAEWAGEVEIVDAKFEILEGNYVAEAADVTELLGTEELAAKQNMLVAFDDMTVSKVEYKNGEPGDDIYVTFTKGDATLEACVEVYLTGTETDVYTTVGTLTEGDVVDVEGFLYWYNGANPHITSIVKN